MSSPNWVADIEAQAGGKPVLLVEGNIDIDILAYFLDHTHSGWETGLVLLPARFKSRVIAGVRDYHPDWAGIVDMDEWPLEEVWDKLKDAPRVKALPRFCLENYFCVPQELWEALPPIQQQAAGNDPGRIESSITEKLPDWVAHGAMWRVIRARRTGLLYQSGFPSELDKAPVTDVDEIRRILKSWHDQLDPDQIIQEYEQELTEAHQLTPDEQLRQYVHGKKFFRQVITPTLNQFFSPTNADTWLQRLRQDSYGLRPPVDMQEFLTGIMDLFDQW